MSQIAHAGRSRERPAEWQRALVRGLLALDWRGIAAFGLPFLLYLWTMAPTIYNLDSAELTTAAATGGITRATGYPLYLLLGRIWSLLPIGDVGYRMNLFSAFNGALTIALADRILRRLDVGAWAAFGALGLLACAPYFWAMSLIAEVYTLQTTLMAGLILLLLRWADQPTVRRLALAALVGGLSLGHHAMTVLLIPGCIWFALVVAPRRVIAPRTLLAVLGAGVLGFCVYLDLPLRYLGKPAFNYAGLYDAAGVFQPVDLRTIGGLWWLITGESFSGLMLAYHGPALWQEVRQYALDLWQSFFAIGIAPAILGLVMLTRRNWRLSGMLVLMFIFSAAFYIDYRAVDKQTMFLPTYLIWALWLGVGYQWLIDWLGSAGDEMSARRSAVAVQGILAACVLIALVWNWRLVDLSNDWSTRTRGEAMLRGAQPGALILGYWGTVPALEYLQLVEGQRPDVQVINRFLIPPPAMDELIMRDITRRPIYIDYVPFELLESVRAKQVGLLYQLCPRDEAQIAIGKGVVGCG